MRVTGQFPVITARGDCCLARRQFIVNVPIGISEESGVVAGVVFGSFAWGAVGGVAGVDSYLVEGVDSCLVRGFKRFWVGRPSTIEKVAPLPRIWVRPW